MSQFPTALPDFDDLDPQATLAVNNHANRHNIVHEEVRAIAEKVGVSGSSDVNSHDKKIADLEDGVETLDTEKTDVAEVESLITAAVDAAVASTKEALYPVGTIYENYDDATNPETLLGFGTWVAVTDRVLVGKGSGTFATAGSTGGAETHTLTLAQIPNATGAIFAHSSRSAWWQPSGVFSTSNQTNVYGAPNGPVGGANSLSSITFNLGGGGGAHNNLQPYVVVYMWRRTA